MFAAIGDPTTKQDQHCRFDALARRQCRCRLLRRDDDQRPSAGNGHSRQLQFLLLANVAGGRVTSLDGTNSRVGLHGNYKEGNLLPGAPARLRAWIPLHTPVNKELMEQWINLPQNKQMMYFYNDRAELCDRPLYAPTGMECAQCGAFDAISQTPAMHGSCQIARRVATTIP
jgi:hypothetical protein